MDRFEAMSILLEAIDAGSLSAAARHLGMPLATVSRRILELEKHLKIRILIRGSRKLMLTEVGRDYVANCRRVLEDVSEIERNATGEYRAPQGELVVYAPTLFSQTHLLPILVEFLMVYPEIRVNVLQGERPVSLLEEHIDLAVRLGALEDSTLIATRIGLIRRVLCAAPAYLNARGVPKTPEDLAGHDCVSFEALTLGNRWWFSKGGEEYAIPIRPRLSVTTAEMAVAAAVAGVGIARVMSFQIAHYMASGSLRLVLEESEPSPVPVTFIYPSQRQVPLKLRAFLDFFTPRLREMLGYQSA